MSLIAAAGILLANTLGTFLALRLPQGMEKHPLFGLLGVVMMLAVGLDLFAFGLGVAGCAQRDTRKTFAIAGTALSTLVFLGTVTVLIAANLAR